MSQADGISTWHRMLSACLGLFITSLVVTPFDVIRIRIQQQEILPAKAQCCQTIPVEQSVRNTLVKNPALSLASTSQLVVAERPELFWINQNYCSQAANCSKIKGTFQGFFVISRNEGPQTLWRGLSLTLFMAIPSNIIYFTGYEYIRDHLPVASHALNPLLCGAVARMMAATFVSPIELIKTRLQLIPTDKKTSPNILRTLLRDSFKQVQQRGIGTMFTGLQITLWRDVPFSGVYWMCYELLKKRIGRALNTDFDKPSDEKKVFATAFLSGSISGSIAAFFTNPFDVGKTRLQITQEPSHKRPSMFTFLRQIYAREGVAALYTGFGPRVMKIAPSCAIMISSYEIGKALFKR